MVFVRNKMEDAPFLFPSPSRPLSLATLPATLPVPLPPPTLPKVAALPTSGQVSISITAVGGGGAGLVLGTVSGRRAAAGMGGGTRTTKGSSSSFSFSLPIRTGFELGPGCLLVLVSGKGGAAMPLGSGGLLL